MRNGIRNTILAGIASLSLAVGVAAPADAAQWHGGGHGFHGGGGWHGGGWHGGGWGPGIGLGIVGGLAAGALLGGAYYGGYGYGGCYRPRPMYDAYGNYLGTRVVNVCY
jgi:hypothetical protein